MRISEELIETKYNFKSSDDWNLENSRLGLNNKNLSKLIQPGVGTNYAECQAGQAFELVDL